MFGLESQRTESSIGLKFRLTQLHQKYTPTLPLIEDLKLYCAQMLAQQLVHVFRSVVRSISRKNQRYSRR